MKKLATFITDYSGKFEDLFDLWDDVLAQIKNFETQNYQQWYICEKTKYTSIYLPDTDNILKNSGALEAINQDSDILCVMSSNKECIKSYPNSKNKFSEFSNVIVFNAMNDKYKNAENCIKYIDALFFSDVCLLTNVYKIEWLELDDGDFCMHMIIDLENEDFKNRFFKAKNDF